MNINRNLDDKTTLKILRIGVALLYVFSAGWFASQYDGGRHVRSIFLDISTAHLVVSFIIILPLLRCFSFVKNSDTFEMAVNIVGVVVMFCLLLYLLDVMGKDVDVQLIFLGVFLNVLIQTPFFPLTVKAYKSN